STAESPVPEIDLALPQPATKERRHPIATMAISFRWIAELNMARSSPWYKVVQGEGRKLLCIKRLTAPNVWKFQHLGSMASCPRFAVNLRVRKCDISAR